MFRRMFVADKNTKAAWSKPELKKINAGSAEAGGKTSKNDGGSVVPHKS